MAGTLALGLGVSFFVHLYLGQLQEGPGTRGIFAFQQRSHTEVNLVPPPVLHTGPNQPTAFLRNHHRLGTCCNHGLGICCFTHSPEGWELSTPISQRGN